MTGTMAVLQRLVDAYDRCDSNRGRFACTAAHDLRCPVARGIGRRPVCACGAAELDAALEAARVALGEEVAP